MSFQHHPNTAFITALPYVMVTQPLTMSFLHHPNTAFNTAIFIFLKSKFLQCSLHNHTTLLTIALPRATVNTSLNIPNTPLQHRLNDPPCTTEIHPSMFPTQPYTIVQHCPSACHINTFFNIPYTTLHRSVDNSSTTVTSFSLSYTTL